MIIRLADCPPQPWKNGLGSTRQIAVHPPAADAEHFLWRVSVAEVDSAAPFSCFPGIDRQITLLEGAGFMMTIDGRRQHALTIPFEPFAFAGEAKVDVTLIDGATRDFNLMVRRGHARGDLQAWTGPATRVTDPTTTLVFCARGEIDTIDGRLHCGDAWCPIAAVGHAVDLHDDAVALVVHIQTRAG